MPNLNKVMLIGNLTRDPETKYTPKGTAVVGFSIAVNRNWTTEGGEKREEVTFIDLEAYARLAEIIGDYCKKGRSVYIEGRLKLDTWEKDGERRSKMKVVVEKVEFLGGGRESEQAPPQRKAPPPRPAADPDLDSAPDDIPF